MKIYIPVLLEHNCSQQNIFFQQCIDCIDIAGRSYSRSLQSVTVASVGKNGDFLPL